MSNVAVSVVVSTHNRSQLLACAIRALLAQRPDTPSHEIIVVDNNSSDDTRAVIEDFESKSGGLVRYVFEPRAGVSHGRNAGVAASRGDILAFTDDDVQVTDTWLLHGMRTLADRPEVAYVGGPVLPQWDGPAPTWLTREHWAPLAIVDYSESAFAVPAERPVCLITANLFVRRAVFDRVGWFDPALRRCQDRDLMLRLWAAGFGGVYAPDVVVRAAIQPERLTKRYHRRWHRTHGMYVARIPLRERWSGNRCTVESAATGHSFLGVPLFECRSLLEHVTAWATCCVSGQPMAAFGHELRVRYSLGFIVSSLRLAPRRTPRSAVVARHTG